MVGSESAMTANPDLPWTVVAAQRDKAVQTLEKIANLEGHEYMNDYKFAKMTIGMIGPALARIAELGKTTPAPISEPHRCLGDCKGHPFQCYGHPTNCPCVWLSETWDGKTERRGGKK